MERCPNIKTWGGGDETLDFCELNGKVCLLVSGQECKEWKPKIIGEYQVKCLACGHIGWTEDADAPCPKCGATLNKRVILDYAESLRE